MRLLAFALLATVCLLATAGSVFAIDKPNRPAPVQPTKIGPSKLTKSECTQLGGSVIDLSDAGEAIAKICNGGSACKTTDQNGKNHMVCINAR